ncbi:hypothetical protein HEP86_01655 [Streptomyces sp. RPA4-5]|uniref:hypothetical protein n=1 Tax=Streptomyces sp. RPA4-5 TaxID=2721245 RepID=UPI00143EB302|nr:hypothetical protein [Streptomyces sp. RPA4-5]QIY53447.1 hypothetical protein HEP86_01655 [Streptomyces sp. RPA4-5]
MNPAVAGLVGAIFGALIAGSATTFGPLLLQRHKDRTEGRQRLEEARVRKVDLVNDVGVQCRAWLLYLSRTLHDRQAGSQVTLAEFDEKCEKLRTSAERALAQAANAGYVLSHSGLADALRSLEEQVRVSLLLPARPEHLAHLHGAANSYFTPRQVVTFRMLDEVLHGRPPSDPTSGTVFERHYPA